MQEGCNMSFRSKRCDVIEIGHGIRLKSSGHFANYFNEYFLNTHLKVRMQQTDNFNAGTWKKYY